VLDFSLERRTASTHPRGSVEGPLLADLLHRLPRQPQSILLLWNWKSALLSMLLRGPIFLMASIRRGWAAALTAWLTESVFCAVTAGYYGGFVQRVRDGRPRWLTGLLITLVMPALFQVLEYALHGLRGTPHLRGAEIASVAASALSALFNWYAMKRGALLVGVEGSNFGSDLLRFPRLILGFVLQLPLWLWNRTRHSSTPRPNDDRYGKIKDSQAGVTEQRCR